MKKYEYKAVAFTESGIKKPGEYETQLNNWLNNLGVDGWEFIQCVKGFYFFKREIE